MQQAREEHLAYDRRSGGRRPAPGGIRPRGRPNPSPCARSRRATLRRRDAIVGDRTPRREQERAVAQEEQMGVEDLRRVAVRSSRDQRALAGDVVSDRAERGISSQLDLSAAGSVGDGEIGRSEPPGGATPMPADAG